MRKKWSKEKIIEEIKSIGKRDLKKLSSRFTQKNNNSLFKATLKYFGSWANAIKAADYDYEKIKLHKKWNAESTIKEIKKVAKKDLGKLSSQYMQKNNSPLYNAAIRYFGSVKNSILLAGLDYKRIKLYTAWDVKKVLKKIGKEDLGKLSDRYMRRHNRSLYDASRRYYGSLGNAIRAADLDYEKIRKLYSSEERCHKTLKKIFKIKVDRFVKFDWLVFKKQMHLDFYISELRLAIEYNGEQHYGSIPRFGGSAEYKLIQKRDRKKKKLLQEHNIKLLIIPYWEKLTEKNIRSILIKNNIGIDIKEGACEKTREKNNE